MDKEKYYYKCLVADCESKYVYDYFPTLVLHYRSEHEGTALPSTEASRLKEIPEGFQLYIPKKKARQAAPISATTDAPAGAPTKPDNVYKETPEPASILKKILESYPGLEKAVVAEIMDWVNLQGNVHPIEVRQLLNLMAGVPKGAADIIPQKYQLALLKAAQEGKTEVQMMMAGWGLLGGNLYRSAGGQPFMPYGDLLRAGQGANSMLGFGFNPALYGGNYWPRYPLWFGQPETMQKDQTESPADIERNKKLEKLEEDNNALRESIQALIGKMEQTEQEKKEAAINARLDKIEGMIVEVASKPKTDETKDKQLEAILNELKETRTEVAKVKEEAAQNRIASLEASVKNLASEIANKDREKMEKLEKELEAAKSAKPPVTGSTEMDVARELVTKGMDTIKDAGKDIKSVVMAGQTSKEFNPARGNPELRREAGKKMAETMEREASLAAAEDSYLKR